MRTTELRFLPWGLLLVATVLAPALSWQSSWAGSQPAPGGHIPLTYGGDNRAAYPVLSPVDVGPIPVSRGLTGVTISPNPFQSLAAIRFALPPGETATVEIFDVSGRIMHRAVSKGSAAGLAEVFWNGRGPSGRPAVSGLYLVRVTAGGRTHVARLVFLR